MSRSLSGFQALVLGVAVLVAVGLAGFGLFSVGGQQWLWGNTFHIEAGFRQIQGVEAGTRVRVLGRDAGVVEEVRLPTTPSGTVMLRLRIDDHVRHLVRTDASAQIVAEGMVGGRVVEIDPGSDAAAQVADNAVIASAASRDWTSVVSQVDAVLDGVRRGEGSLGKLLKDDTAYDELIRSIQQARGTLVSLKQNADAVKGMPVVRSYVVDPYKELVRPDCECQRRSYREGDLFAPGRAVLTAEGRKHLDNLARWVNEHKEKGSEVVVAAYAAPPMNPELAQAVTQKQSQAVCDYLINRHAVHKLGWFSRRKVEAIGLGTERPPQPNNDQLPLPRVEVLVFVPQG